MAQRDYYEVLGLDKSADADAIKRAYRQLAKKYHPDLNPGDAEAEKNFKEVNEAYSILSDADKKAKYDQFGHAAFDPTAGGGYGGGGFSGGFGDFGDLGDIFGSIFGGAFGGGTQKRGPRRGDDVGVRLTLTFEEAAFGCKKDVSYNRLHKCPHCNGTGAAAGTTPETCPDCRGAGQRVTVQRMGGMSFQSKVTCEKCHGTGKFIKEPCRECRGSGLERENRKLTVTIPAGIDNGGRIALRGQGCDGTLGGPSGDLIIEVAVRSHSIFERDGVNIFCDVPVSIVEATLGGEVEVPTLEGMVKYKLDEGTQPGTTFTLRGKGIPYINRSGNQNAPQKRGDLICTVVVEVPRGLSEKQKDLLRDFADACGEKNYAKKGKHKRK